MLEVIILLLCWHFGSRVAAFSVSALDLHKMLRYRVVPSSATAVLPFPSGPAAFIIGLGTPWFLGPILSQALFCGRTGTCFIRTQDNESASLHRSRACLRQGPVTLRVFLLLVLPCFSSLLLSEASGERVGWSHHCQHCHLFKALTRVIHTWFW